MRPAREAYASVKDHQTRSRGGFFVSAPAETARRLLATSPRGLCLVSGAPTPPTTLGTASRGGLQPVSTPQEDAERYRFLRDNYPDKLAALLGIYLQNVSPEALDRIVDEIRKPE